MSEPLFWMARVREASESAGDALAQPASKQEAAKPISNSQVTKLLSDKWPFLAQAKQNGLNGFTLT